MRINSMGSSLNTINSMNQTKKKIDSLFNQLSSGKRITSAKVDPAGAALAQSLRSNSSSLGVANQNISSTLNALNIASGATSQSLEQLQSLREVAVQASNGNLNDSDRAALNEQFQQGVENLDDISNNTEYNGTNLLDGSYSQSVQTGTEAGQETSVSIRSLSSNSLGVSGQNVSTQSAAQDSLAAIDTAISRATAEASRIGASQNALEYRQNANAIAQENIEAARSQAEDADVAETTSELSKANLIQEAQVAVLKEQMKQKAAAVQLITQQKK